MEHAVTYSLRFQRMEDDMIDALWSMTFSSNQAPGLKGSGVVVIENGRIRGGDSMFLFIGDVMVQNDTVKARVRVKQYASPPNMKSLTGRSDYVGLFQGKIDRNNIRLNGTVEGAPQAKLTVDLTRQAELG
jgi:hypothetical protein